jgi:hypothetical protein
MPQHTKFSTNQDAMSVLARNVATDGAGSMSENQCRFCYHCRKDHPESEMRKINSAQGSRWRCRSSLAAARQAPKLRDAFGENTTSKTRASSQRSIAFVNQLKFLTAGA